MDTLTARAVCNALWPHLKAGRARYQGPLGWTEGWRTETATRDLADHGDRPQLRSTASAIRHAARAYDQDVIHERIYIQAVIWPSEWPGNRHLAIHLAQLDYLELRQAHPGATIDLDHALKNATCRKPYRLSQGAYRLNEYAENLSPAAGRMLERTAGICTISFPEQHSVLDALIGDADIPDAGQPSLNELAATLERGT